jgi:hypothetical protein
MPRPINKGSPSGDQVIAKYKQSIQPISPTAPILGYYHLSRFLTRGHVACHRSHDGREAQALADLGKAKAPDRTIGQWTELRALTTPYSNPIPIPETEAALWRLQANPGGKNVSHLRPRCAGAFAASAEFGRANPTPQAQPGRER